jgi:DDE superfamily endonuclease
MKFLKKAIKNEEKFQRIFGLRAQQLKTLVVTLTPIWEKAEHERLARSDRKREIGAGHPYALPTLEEKVCTVLLYYKLYPTQEVLGIIVGIDQSAVSRLLKRMLPLIEQAADHSLKTYLAQAKKDLEENKIKSINELFERYPDLIEKIPDHVPHRFDSGYQGVKKEHPEKYLILPIKKPRSRELNSLEKEHNKANSKRRVVSEYRFAQIKKFRICSGVYRQPLGTYNQTFRNIAALINFRQQFSSVTA